MLLTDVIKKVISQNVTLNDEELTQLAQELDIFFGLTVNYLCEDFVPQEDLNESGELALEDYLKDLE